MPGQNINQSQFDEETRLRLAEAQLGMQVEDFLKTPVGRYILGRAEMDVAEGVEMLKRADPEDAKAIRKAQDKANLAETLLGWLKDAIVNGRNAETQLQGQPED